MLPFHGSNEPADCSDAPIELAPDVWWVGRRLPDDRFQCHAYYLRNGNNGVLIDPGSPLTIETTLAKVARIDDLSAIRYLVCHHCDPDIAAALPMLSERLSRPDIQVVTEWRAMALLRHYGHRFDYYLVEEQNWRLPLEGDRALEFQLTPYLHFPGAMVSYDTASRILFSSDLFGGFVPDAANLICRDLDVLIASAKPFHQHYMPSTELLSAGLTRVQQRWPQIAMIAPQHGHVVPGPLVEEAFSRLKALECGIFALADADIDLKRLLRIAEARSRLFQVLLSQAAPTQMLVTLKLVLQRIRGVRDCVLSIDLPDQGWTSWSGTPPEPRLEGPPPNWEQVELSTQPPTKLSLLIDDQIPVDEDVLRMLKDITPSLQSWIDGVVEEHQDHLRMLELRQQATTDPLTGLTNRRALEDDQPSGAYALLSFDIDFFKRINDSFGHAAGDQVLKKVAAVMTKAVREGDAVYRLGGEEFLVVLPQIDPAMALGIGERIRSQVKVLDLQGLAPDGGVTISAGLFVADPDQPLPFDAALAMADGALYLSKEQGRDRLTVA
ncbi:diguanylate cyclase [Synechococcus sp. CBW1107]|uniref:diguanylate cyclase n=1 Tax=Synechococcus sp. CBW1107 TaxID=2789857 RepID=UPI002AD21FE0|nr:diguanylate cyclase [Synechococcus sp. CBW1107]